MARLIASVLFIVNLAFVPTTYAGSTRPLIPIVRAFASHEQRPNVAANAIDGDLDTRWSALGDTWAASDIALDPGWDPQEEDKGTWIAFELERCASVGAVHIAWHKGDERVAFFAIELSEDGVNWKRDHFGVGFGGGDTLDLEYVPVEDRFGCFLRIVGFGNTVNAWNSITEVRIEGELIGSSVLDIFAVSASNWQEPNVPGNTLDMDLGTRWSAQGNGQWIEFDLGEDIPIPIFDQVSIAWYQGDTRSFTFVIETSRDGISWLKIYSGYSSGTTADLQPYGFADAGARYVRIVGFGNSQNDWNSITEVELRHTE